MMGGGWGRATDWAGQVTADRERVTKKPHYRDWPSNCGTGTGTGPPDHCQKHWAGQETTGTGTGPPGPGPGPEPGPGPGHRATVPGPGQGHRATDLGNQNPAGRYPGPGPGHRDRDRATSPDQTKINLYPHVRVQDRLRI